MSFKCAKDQKLMKYLNDDKRPSVWYTTRNGQQGLQWGNTPPFSRMCPCALNNSCKLNLKCNCDSGEPSLDEGINSNIQLLPILQLFIGGGTNSQSLANISIGPLKCSGNYISEIITFTDRNQRLITSFNFNNSKTFYTSINIKLTHKSLTIFTFTSTNQERWFQLSIRNGYLVGQIVNGGLINEIISDILINDNNWHLISWEVDEQKQILSVDYKEKILKDFYILPKTSILIIGSRTYLSDRSGFAGQLKHFILNGEYIRLGQLAKKLLGNGIQLGDWGASKENNGKCKNEGICEELYDGFKCK
uniref:LAM_G_DOMAIN domain-containing protein n=1 Tax=Meloidogyne hapla TaxID=6305 RepID=A0A1I8BQF4_MELHA